MKFFLMATTLLLTSSLFAATLKPISCKNIGSHKIKALVTAHKFLGERIQDELDLKLTQFKIENKKASEPVVNSIKQAIHQSNTDWGGITKLVVKEIKNSEEMEAQEESLLNELQLFYWDYPNTYRSEVTKRFKAFMTEVKKPSSVLTVFALEHEGRMHDSIGLVFYNKNTKEIMVSELYFID